MPVYTYQCHTCGLRTEKRRKLSKRAEPLPCLSCSAEMELKPPDSVSGHFNKEVTSIAPQNTGIHDLDTKHDKVIGQSAKQGWDVHKQRVHDKLEVMRKAGVTDPRRLSKQIDGSYEVLTPEEAGVSVRSVEIQSEYSKWSRRRRLARKESLKGT